jgi:hypothetical protein
MFDWHSNYHCVIITQLCTLKSWLFQRKANFTFVMEISSSWDSNSCSLCNLHKILLKILCIFFFVQFSQKFWENFVQISHPNIRSKNCYTALVRAVSERHDRKRSEQLILGFRYKKIKPKFSLKKSGLYVSMERTEPSTIVNDRQTN